MRSFDIVSIAQKHAIARDVASPDFFEGALLGNGDLGVVVCTRPDGIVLHLGHNNIWDIRIAEGHRDKIGTFEEVWGKVQDIKGNPYDDPWYQEYMREVTSSYHNYKYPRPYPASSLYLFFDRKEYEVLGHSLDISNGLLTITLQNNLIRIVKICYPFLFIQRYMCAATVYLYINRIHYSATCSQSANQTSIS